jgi:hypothetical protein
LHGIALQLDKIALQLDRIALQLDRIALQLDRIALQLGRLALQLHGMALQLGKLPLQLDRLVLQLHGLAMQLYGKGLYPAFCGRKCLTGGLSQHGLILLMVSNSYIDSPADVCLLFGIKLGYFVGERKKKIKRKITL